jgi:hypothetical protein
MRHAQRSVPMPAPRGAYCLTCAKARGELRSAKGLLEWLKISVKVSAILPVSNTASPRPSVLSAWHAPPSCDGFRRAPGAAVHDAPSAPPGHGEPRPDICARILARRRRVRALPVVHCGHPSFARRVSACPRISVERASAGVPPSSPPSSAPCLRAWSVPSTGHHEADTSASRGWPSCGNALAIFGDSGRRSGGGVIYGPFYPVYSVNHDITYLPYLILQLQRRPQRESGSAAEGRRCHQEQSKAGDAASEDAKLRSLSGQSSRWRSRRTDNAVIR